MENFTYEELKLIRYAIDNEIMCRSGYPCVNPQITMKFESLYNKVDSLIKNIEKNN